METLQNCVAICVQGLRATTLNVVVLYDLELE